MVTVTINTALTGKRIHKRRKYRNMGWKQKGEMFAKLSWHAKRGSPCALVRAPCKSSQT